MSGLADYGRAKSYISSGIVILVALIVVSVAVLMARSSANDVHKLPVKATLKDVTCQTTKSEVKGSDGVTRTTDLVTCTASADYSVNGTRYTAQGLTFTGTRSNGTVVEIYANPGNPNDVISGKPMPPVVGYGIASVAVLFAAGAVAWAYFMSKSDTFATVHGAREAAGDVRDLFRGGDAVPDSLDWDPSFSL